MVSIHPSSPDYRLAVVPTRIWSLCTYSVANSRTQQRILRSILHLKLDGVTALGAQRGTQFFVIIDYGTAADRAQATHVVLSFDPHATITFACRNRQVRLDLP